MTYLLIHFILGIVGSILITKLEVNQGHDFTVTDLVLAIFATVLGPFIFGVAILFSFTQPSKVLIKGKKQ